MQLPFADRYEAGRVLAERLRREALPVDLVLGLPRGGIPVAAEVARVLGVPLDVFVVRKLGVPGHEELAMGAIASGSVTVLNPEVVDMLRIPASAIARAAAAEQAELERRERTYREGRPPEPVTGRDVWLVDDGLATGASMRAAVRALRESGPRSLSVAVPVAAAETCENLTREADTVVCLATPEPFVAVGLWYRDFRATTDDEVRDLLRAAHPRRAAVADKTGGPGAPA
ncbi:MAG TPA: phosphoribosyltransferase [Tepidiformaceae bacterium]|nr:phosphoribosyltransferase [Tepidiformaceae bacterium]